MMEFIELLNVGARAIAMYPLQDRANRCGYDGCIQRDRMKDAKGPVTTRWLT
jgi:hypothetical protein